MSGRLRNSAGALVGVIFLSSSTFGDCGEESVGE